jgi:large subunit ribosomal protein L25
VNAQFNTEDMGELKVEFRQGSGKGVARKLRASGLIPGVFYGVKSDPIPLAMDPDVLVEALTTPRLKNTMLKIVSDNSDLDGKFVMVKEIQRHPVSRDFLHVDLMEIYPNYKIRTRVPLKLIGNSVGVDAGGTLDQHTRMVDVKCAPRKIPETFEIDVTELNIGDSLRLDEVEFGEDIEILGEKRASVVSVAVPRVLETIETDEDEEGEEGLEGEEGEGEEGEAKEGEAKDGDAKKGEAKPEDKKKK